MMAFDLEKTEELLNGLGLELMSISPENLAEIGGLLVKFEAVGEFFAPPEAEPLARLLTAAEESLKSVLLGRTTNAARALELIGEGLTLLLELARCQAAGAPFKGDPAAWQASLGRLADAEGFLDSSSPASRPEPIGAQDPAAPQAAAPALSWERLSANKFKAQFVAATEELQVALVTLEQKPEPQAAIGELRGRFRAILSAANLVSFRDAADLAYNSAELIAYVINDHLPYSTGVTDILLKACDYLLKAFREAEIAPDEARGWRWRVPAGAYGRQELAEFNDRLWLARQGVLPAARAAAEEAPVSGASQPAKPKKIGEILVEKGLISQGDLGGLIEAQQNERKATLGDILIEQRLITQSDLEEALAEQKKSSGQRIGEILVRLGKATFDQIDQAVKNQEEKRETKLGEFLLKSKIGAPDKVALALREQKRSEGGRTLTAAAQTVKVETDKLDGIIDLVGELVIAQSLITANEALHGLKEQKLNKDLAQVSRITSELQRNAMSLRMVQMSHTFQKINRLVRDLAHKFDKDVKFETVGGDTEIDRNMVDSIYDPLVHLVRNSLDHGLESRAERKTAGKSPQGSLKLKAYHQGGNVVIEMADDGRGLDKEKALRKAIEKGMVAPGEKLSEAAIHALVFQPGFSTADKISEISGRGVGMDVVKQTIDKLRGRVDFSSQFGFGSTMTIRLPLTLAIIDGMIVLVGGNRYILPTISIIESFRPPRRDYFTVKNQGELIRVRERLVPLVRLDRLVGSFGALTEPEDALAVIVENEGEIRCLLVDQVLGKQEVVIKSLGERLKNIRALAGGTILGDGRVGLILDVAGLFEEAAGQTGPARPDGAAAEDDWDMKED